MSAFRGRVWQQRLRHRVYDPVLCEAPRDLWALPAHVARMGPFTIAEVRRFPEAPSCKWYIDIVLVANGERYTLILRRNDENDNAVAAWEFIGRTDTAFVVRNDRHKLYCWEIEPVALAGRPLH